MRPAREAGRCDVKCPCCGRPLDVESSDIRQSPNGGWPDVTADECPCCGDAVYVWMHDVMAFRAVPAGSTAHARAHGQADAAKSRTRTR